MSFKAASEILTADPRFSSLVAIENGLARPMTFEDHHLGIEAIALNGASPAEVRDAFDRARNVLLYAWFAYDLLVVGEAQAFGALELALRMRLAAFPAGRPGTLRNLVDRARKHRVLPPKVTDSSGLLDPIEAIILMRNALAHGSSAIHTPGIAIEMLEVCAQEIDALFPS
jgi:hypothetical protein